MNKLSFIYPKQFKDLKKRYTLFTIDGSQRRKRLSCAQCKDILIEPRQMNCGCRFCSRCIKECKNICSEEECKTLENNSESIYDKAAEREIFGLEIRCINKGCPHKCKLRDLNEHLNICEYKRKDTECDKLTAKCGDCGVEISEEDLKGKHRNIKGDTALLCDNWKSICRYKCSEEVQDNIKMHLNICPNMPIECAMKGVGCSKLLPREEMADHIRNDAHYHMTLMMQEMINLRIENESIKSEYLISIDKRNNEIKKFKDTVIISVRGIKMMSDKVLICETKYRNLLNETSVIKQTLNSNGIIKSGLQDFASSLASISKDGYFVWKIDNIIDKIKDAKRGINNHIFSESFYSHIPGYKMCLKMYPCGDGKRAENHVSIYFVIMKGEYDEEVSWPYMRKISISLQSNDSSIKHRTINMKPDANNNCYGKPVNVYNLAAGQPKFISHVELISTDEFIENGTISIHTKVF